MSKAYKIENSKKKDLILLLLSDKHCRQILQNIRYKSKTALEISAETNVPVSTVYRKLEIFHENKLVTVSGTMTNRRKLFFYKSRVKEIKSRYENGHLDVNVIFERNPDFENPDISF